ncbi:hypothetical protein HYW82_04305, partial [Candidatus Peregrinibacteria bacterium]|nr:hypothetical protein [Candidatus Peregrinibacteria bacterium]
MRSKNLQDDTVQAQDDKKMMTKYMKDYEKLLQYSLSLLAKKRYTGQEIEKKMNAYL